MTKDRALIVDKIEFDEKYLHLVQEKKKTSTIRLGYVLPKAIQISLVFGDTQIEEKAQIEKIDFTKSFSDLTESDAVTDGFESLNDLKSDLKKFYPNISANSRCTIIHFRLLSV